MSARMSHRVWRSAARVPLAGAAPSRAVLCRVGVALRGRRVVPDARPLAPDGLLCRCAGRAESQSSPGRGARTQTPGGRPGVGRSRRRRLSDGLGVVVSEVGRVGTLADLGGDVAQAGWSPTRSQEQPGARRAHTYARRTAGCLRPAPPLVVAGGQVSKARADVGCRACRKLAASAVGRMRFWWRRRVPLLSSGEPGAASQPAQRGPAGRRCSARRISFADDASAASRVVRGGWRQHLPAVPSGYLRSSACC